MYSTADVHFELDKGIHFNCHLKEWKQQNTKMTLSWSNKQHPLGKVKNNTHTHTGGHSVSWRVFGIYWLPPNSSLPPRRPLPLYTWWRILSPLKCNTPLTTAGHFPAFKRHFSTTSTCTQTGSHLPLLVVQMEHCLTCFYGCVFAMRLIQNWLYNLYSTIVLLWWIKMTEVLNVSWNLQHRSYVERIRAWLAHKHFSIPNQKDESAMCESKCSLKCKQSPKMVDQKASITSCFQGYSSIP